MNYTVDLHWFQFNNYVHVPVHGNLEPAREGRRLLADLSTRRTTMARSTHDGSATILQA